MQVLDKHSGAILIKKDPSESRIEQLEKDNEEMRQQISELLSLMKPKKSKSSK